MFLFLLTSGSFLFSNDTRNRIADIVMYDEDYDVQLGGELYKYNDPKLTVMREVEQTVSLFFTDVAKIPTTTQMDTYHDQQTKYLVMIFIIRSIQFSSLNPVNFAIGILCVYG